MAQPGLPDSGKSQMDSDMSAVSFAQVLETPLQSWIQSLNRKAFTAKVAQAVAANLAVDGFFSVRSLLVMKLPGDFEQLKTRHAWRSLHGKLLLKGLLALQEHFRSDHSITLHPIVPPNFSAAGQDAALEFDEEQEEQALRAWFAVAGLESCAQLFLDEGYTCIELLCEAEPSDLHLLGRRAELELKQPWTLGQTRMVHAYIQELQDAQSPHSAGPEPGEQDLGSEEKRQDELEEPERQSWEPSLVLRAGVSSFAENAGAELDLPSMDQSSQPDVSVGAIPTGHVNSSFADRFIDAESKIHVTEDDLIGAMGRLTAALGVDESHVSAPAQSSVQPQGGTPVPTTLLHADEDRVLRLYGLPLDVSPDDIVSFFAAAGFSVVADSVTLETEARGQKALVAMQRAEDTTPARMQLNRRFIKGRPIVVTAVKTGLSWKSTTLASSPAAVAAASIASENHTESSKPESAGDPFSLDETRAAPQSGPARRTAECPECKKEFTDPSKLAVHIYVHRNVEAAGGSHTSDEESDVPKLQSGTESVSSHQSGEVGASSDRDNKELDSSRRREDTVSPPVAPTGVPVSASAGAGAASPSDIKQTEETKTVATADASVGTDTELTDEDTESSGVPLPHDQATDDVSELPPQTPENSDRLFLRMLLTCCSRDDTCRLMLSELGAALQLSAPPKPSSDFRVHISGSVTLAACRFTTGSRVISTHDIVLVLLYAMHCHAALEDVQLHCVSLLANIYVPESVSRTESTGPAGDEKTSDMTDESHHAPDLSSFGGAIDSLVSSLRVFTGNLGIALRVLSLLLWTPSSLDSIRTPLILADVLKTLHTHPTDIGLQRVEFALLREMLGQPRADSVTTNVVSWLRECGLGRILSPSKVILPPEEEDEELLELECEEARDIIRGMITPADFSRGGLSRLEQQHEKQQLEHRRGQGWLAMASLSEEAVCALSSETEFGFEAIQQALSESIFLESESTLKDTDSLSDPISFMQRLASDAQRASQLNSANWPERVVKLCISVLVPDLKQQEQSPLVVSINAAVGNGRLLEHSFGFLRNMSLHKDADGSPLALSVLNSGALDLAVSVVRAILSMDKDHTASSAPVRPVDTSVPSVDDLWRTTHGGDVLSLYEQDGGKVKGKGGDKALPGYRRASERFGRGLLGAAQRRMARQWQRRREHGQDSGALLWQPSDMEDSKENDSDSQESNGLERSVLVQLLADALNLMWTILGAAGCATEKSVIDSEQPKSQSRPMGYAVLLALNACLDMMGALSSADTLYTGEADQPLLAALGSDRVHSVQHLFKTQSAEVVELQTLCLRTLLALICSFDAGQIVVAHERGVDGIVEALTSFRLHREAALSAVAVISCLCTSPDRCEVIYEVGAVPAIVSVLQAHSTDLQLAAVGLRALGQLSAYNQEVQRHVVRCGGLDALRSYVWRQPKHSWLLLEPQHTTDSEEKHVAFASSRSHIKAGTFLLSSLIQACLEGGAHAPDSHLNESAHPLWQREALSSATRQQLTEHENSRRGLFDTLHSIESNELLAVLRKARTRRYATMRLVKSMEILTRELGPHNLVQWSLENGTLAQVLHGSLSAEGATLLLKLMQAFPRSLRIQSSTLYILRRILDLTQFSRNMGSVLAAAGAVDTIIAAMVAHAESSAVCRHGMRVVSRLPQHYVRETCELRGLTSITQVIVASLQVHATDLDLLADGVRLLSMLALCTHERLAELKGLLVVSNALRAAVEHCTDAEEEDEDGASSSSSAWPSSVLSSLAESCCMALHNCVVHVDRRPRNRPALIASGCVEVLVTALACRIRGTASFLCSNTARRHAIGTLAHITGRSEALDRFLGLGGPEVVLRLVTDPHGHAESVANSDTLLGIGGTDVDEADTRRVQRPFEESIRDDRLVRHLCHLLSLAAGRSYEMAAYEELSAEPSATAKRLAGSAQRWLVQARSVALAVIREDLHLDNLAVCQQAMALLDHVCAFQGLGDPLRLPQYASRLRSCAHRYETNCIVSRHAQSLGVSGVMQGDVDRGEQASAQG